jgi:hypothetical protein
MTENKKGTGDNTYSLLICFTCQFVVAHSPTYQLCKVSDGFWDVTWEIGKNQIA